MFLSCVTAVIVWFLSPPLLAWLSPALLGLFLAVPLSRASGSERLGTVLSRLALLRTPEELHTPALVVRRQELLRDAGELPDDGLRLTGTQPRIAADAHQRQFGETRGPARPSGSLCLHSGTKVEGCPITR